MRTKYTLGKFIVAAAFFMLSICQAQSSYNLILSMSGNDEIPSVTTNGYGFGWAKLDLNQRTLTYVVAYDSLSGPPTGAHFHLGQAGANGPVIYSVTFDANGVAMGELTNLSDTTMAHFLKGRFYCNIHTSAHPGGEIRGQVEYAGPLTFTFLAEGSNENPPTGEMGKAVGFAVLSPTGSIAVVGVFKGLSGAATAMHIHYGAADQNGGVAIPLVAVGSMITGGGLMPNDSSYRKLLAGEMYYNIHTSAHPGGELRGQLMGSTFYPFWAQIDGSQEAPPITSTGEGFFLLRYNSMERTIEYGSQIVGLTDVTGAHIHGGAIGQSGGVMIPISYSATGYVNTDEAVTVVDSVVRRLCTMEAYANVHTSANPGGEIRGQILPAYDATAIAFLDGGQEAPSNTSNGTGVGAVMFPTDESDSQEMYFSLLVNGMSGPATAAHIHTGEPGQNGGVLFPLQATLNGTVAEVADSIMVELLRGGKHYMNVHTSANPGGEIRGDIFAIDGINNGGPDGVREITNTGTARLFKLEQNYPNPFNPSTTIRFAIPASGVATLKVYDILGKEVATLINESYNAGTYEVKFNASQLSSGMYFYQLKSGNFVQTKKLLLLK